jgi:putative membrane protein
VGEHAGHADLAVAGAGIGIGLVATVGYLLLVANDGRRWPRHRSLAWAAACALGATALALPSTGAGPFTEHMAGHVLLGMVVPLLLVVAAPITVLLRQLPTPSARSLIRALASRPLRVLTEPAVAAGLNISGLVVLYTTGAYAHMQTQPLVHLLVHVHLILGGYLFTVALISVDPLPHRRGPLHRAAVLILAIAAHDILAKYLYTHPPVGVAAADARSGAVLMYYAGDAVHLVVIIVFCAQWYRRPQPRGSLRLAGRF